MRTTIRFFRQYGVRVVAVLIVFTLYLLARLPDISYAERVRLARDFSFATAALTRAGRTDEPEGQAGSPELVAYLLADKLLRGSSGPVPLTVRQGSARAGVEITLRRAALTDPPILSALPLLMGSRNV